MNLEANSIKLSELIFRFVRKQRFVGLEFGIPLDQITDGLTHREQSVLFVLNAMPEINVRDLAKHSGIERSWMSRVVTSLEKQSLVKSVSSTYDKRSKVITLTSKGRKKLIESENIVKELFVKNLDTLNDTEISKFKTYLTTFADGINASVFENSEEAHPVAFQLGRIGAELGLYADNVLSTSLTVNQLQTLLILNLKKDKESSITEIDNLLPMDTSSVSRIIQLFVKRDWVTKVKSDKDKRSFSVKISKSGLKIVDKYQSNVVKKFSPSLSKFSNNELTQFLNIYKKVGTREGEKIECNNNVIESKESEYQNNLEILNITNKTKGKFFVVNEDEKLKAVCKVIHTKDKISKLEINAKELSFEETNNLINIIKNQLS